MFVRQLVKVLKVLLRLKNKKHQVF